ncbi:MAG: transposase [Deltaproteobacteria bacterium]|nr:transposase [Deltaproteobacteria bacterium]
MRGSAGSQQGARRPNRRSIRLPGYDYSQAGAYFVTICTKNRECLFGDMVNHEMALNNAGRMVEIVWNELPEYYPRVSTDIFQIMPNHIHGIIIIVGATPRGCPTTPRGCPTSGQAQGPAPTGGTAGVGRTLSLPDIVHRFKTMTTKRYADGVKQYGWPPFPGKLWQRNYYEHIIRNKNEMVRIREYITNNPTQWTTDRENPLAKTESHPAGS